jgi:tetratricopeptide (TPR) repeat protein
VFNTGVRALTEEMAVAGDGLVPAGRNNPVAERAAASLSEHYAAIAREQPHFRKLEGLADLVVLCRLWRTLGVTSPLLERLSQLPYRRVAVPDSYPGIKETVIDTPQLQVWLFGGVQMKAGVGPRSWLILDDEELTALCDRARAADFARGVTVPLTGARIHLPEANRSAGRAVGTPGAALRWLAAQDYAAALAEGDRAVKAEPDEAPPLVVRALAHLCRGEVGAARRDALRATPLCGDNPGLALLLAYVLGYSDALIAEGGAVVEPGKGLVVKAGGREEALLRGTVLMMLGKGAEARDQLLTAVERDPTYAPAYARLALVEVAEDFRLQGKKHAQKALGLNANLIEAKAALALSELHGRHLTAAEKLAREVLAHPAPDLHAKQMAYQVLVGVAAARGDWKAARRWLRRAEASLAQPPLVPLWLYTARLALRDGQKELAAECVARADRVAPHAASVKTARERLAEAGVRELPTYLPEPTEEPDDAPPPERGTDTPSAAGWDWLTLTPARVVALVLAAGLLAWLGLQIRRRRRA